MTPATRIYLIPGLGFDHRAFGNLDLSNYEVHWLDWIEPESRRESIKSYATRMAAAIEEYEGKTVLIGHSFGGIMSQEIAAGIKPVDQVILISSIRSRKENPWTFKILAPLGLHIFFTRQMTLLTFPLWAKQHDYVTPEEQALFKDILSQQSNRKLQWSLKRLSLWREPVLPDTTEVIQIHGDADKTFPIKKIKKADHVLPGGAHFMVYRHAKQLSQWIRQAIRTK